MLGYLRNEEQRNVRQQHQCNELEESMDTETGTSSSAAALMMTEEAVMADTRETQEALTVSALPQTHAMSHRADTTAEGFFQAHKDMTVTTREQARKKQLDFLESMKVYEEVYAGDVPSRHARHVWTLGGDDEDAQSLESQQESARLRRTSQ